MSTKRKKKRQNEHQPAPVAVQYQELAAILDKATQNALSAEEVEKLRGTVETLAFLTNEIQKKRTTISRLRYWLFGSKSEKTSKVFGGDQANTPATGGQGSQAKKPKPKGHGRNGAAQYTGAKRIRIAHPKLNAGQACPECLKGKLYGQEKPGVIVRITGVAPVSATVYERENLRCNLCGEVFAAPAPEGVGEAKYDEAAAAMVGMLKYGTGMPFARLEKLQASLGIPLPAATAWELVRDAARPLQPVMDEMIRQAAQGQVVHNDDTTARILNLGNPDHMDEEVEPGGVTKKSGDKQRKGVFTSGIIGVREGKQIALFFTGPRHAGENLADVLSKRADELGPPIQMCDMLEANTTGDFTSILAGCNAHARRRYVEVADNFPTECRLVLDCWKEVYQNDAFCRQTGMDAQARLAYHQQHSARVMADLKSWAETQLADHLVEPNGSLGEAITFMLKHWDRITLFLSVPAAPLDNNCVERLLKKSILHRKNALFFKTTNGAKVADLFMSLIHTTELARENVFEYLVALLKHPDQVATDPANWLPWTFRQSLAKIQSTFVPPG